LGGGGPSVSHKRNCEPTNESAKRVKISNEKPTDDPTENSVEDAIMPMEGILVNHKQDTIIESLVERKPEEYFHSQIADTRLHRERARFRRAEARKHALEGRSEAAYPLYAVAISEDKLAEEGFAPILQAHKNSGCMFANPEEQDDRHAFSEHGTPQTNVNSFNTPPHVQKNESLVGLDASQILELHSSKAHHAIKANE